MVTKGAIEIKREDSPSLRKESHPTTTQKTVWKSHMFKHLASYLNQSTNWPIVDFDSLNQSLVEDFPMESHDDFSQEEIHILMDPTPDSSTEFPLSPFQSPLKRSSEGVHSNPPSAKRRCLAEKENQLNHSGSTRRLLFSPQKQAPNPMNFDKIFPKDSKEFQSIKLSDHQNFDLPIIMMEPSTPSMEKPFASFIGEDTPLNATLARMLNLKASPMKFGKR